MMQRIQQNYIWLIGYGTLLLLSLVPAVYLTLWTWRAIHSTFFPDTIGNVRTVLFFLSAVQLLSVVCIRSILRLNRILSVTLLCVSFLYLGSLYGAYVVDNFSSPDYPPDSFFPPSMSYYVYIHNFNTLLRAIIPAYILFSAVVVYNCCFNKNSFYRKIIYALLPVVYCLFSLYLGWIWLGLLDSVYYWESFMGPAG